MAPSYVYMSWWPIRQPDAIAGFIPQSGTKNWASGLCRNGEKTGRQGHSLIRHSMEVYSLQRHNTENSKQIFPEKELRGLIPTFMFL